MAVSNLAIIGLLYGLLFFPSEHVLSSSIDCSQYTSCTDCTLRSDCAWQSNNGVCSVMDTSSIDDNWVNETPGCQDSNPVTIVSLDKNEMVSYSLNIESCVADYESSALNLDDLDSIVFDSSSDSCQSSDFDLTFWVLESDDDTMCYELLGRVDDHVAPCDIIIKNGIMTSITCPDNVVTIDETSGQDGQSILLYSALKLLLPRTESELFNENNNISDEDGKGNVLSQRKSVHDDENECNVLSKEYDLNSFEHWQSDVIPIKMFHYESVDVSDANNHINTAKLNELYVFGFNDDTTYNVQRIEVTLTMINEILLTDLSILTDLYNELYSGDDSNYYTTTLTSHDWYKGQYSDGDYNLNFNSDTDNDSDGSNRRRRRTLHIDPIITFSQVLYTSPTIFGQTFSVSIEGEVGIDCLWTPTPSPTSLPDLPILPPNVTTCLWDELNAFALFPILQCGVAFKQDLEDCSINMHETAELNALNCIDSGLWAGTTCDQDMQDWIDMDIFGAADFLEDTFGVNVDNFILLADGLEWGDFNPISAAIQLILKTLNCQIDCVNGGGITGDISFILNVNGNPFYSYTVPFDKTAEFSDDLLINILDIDIPTGIPGVFINIDFDAYAEWGLIYNEFNSGVAPSISYNEQAIPWAKVGIVLGAGPKVSVVFASFTISLSSDITLIDFKYPITVTLVGFISNPLNLQQPTITQNAEWGPITLQWSVDWEFCVGVDVGLISFHIACESGTLFEFRRLLAYGDSYSDNVYSDRSLLADISEPAKSEQVHSVTLGSFWTLEEGVSIVYNVKANLCFQIFANDDLEDYIIFNDMSNAIDSIGLTRDWLAEHITMMGTYTVLYLNKATISVTPNTNDQSTTLGCEDGLPYEVYVPSTMCIELVFVTRYESDLATIEHRLVTNSASQEYFIDQLRILLLDTNSPYLEFIDSIDITSGVGSVMSLGSELFGESPPTQGPTSMPTMAPTFYRYDLITKCNNDPCDCVEPNGSELDSHCNICHPNGCDECAYGYFKVDYNYKCESCDMVFGEGCQSCQDFIGCSQCKSNYLRYYDDVNDLYYCEEDGSTHVSDDWRFDRNPTCQCPYECNNDPCTCGELEHCSICHPNGCDECESGYFKKDYNTPCLQCQETFGDSCMFCQDFNGCGQCIDGYTRYYDEECGLYYCALPPPAPQPVTQPTIDPLCPIAGNFEPCINDNCFGDDNPYCPEQNQYPWGCGSCQQGSFKINFDYKCELCNKIDGCVSCSDWQGCNQCSSGNPVYNENCGFHICV